MGRERSALSPGDERIDRAGRYGASPPRSNVISKASGRLPRAQRAPVGFRRPISLLYKRRVENSRGARDGFALAVSRRGESLIIVRAVLNSETLWLQGNFCVDVIFYQMAARAGLASPQC